MHSLSYLVASLALAVLFASPAYAQVVSSPYAINFQGRLATSSGNPVPDGNYSIRFRFYDAATAGNVLYEKTIAIVQIKNGTFAVLLDAIGATAFNGNTWLGIKIGSDMELRTRTQIVSVPYALKSNLALTVPDGSLTNAKIAAGTLTADRFASGVLNANLWLLGGNSGINPASHFLGTTDDQPLEFRVNGRRAMRYHYAENSTYRSLNVLGGSELNEMSTGVVGATIAGGGYASLTGTDLPNRVSANLGTVGGGYDNRVNGGYSTIAGGGSNTASGLYAVITGGSINTANGHFSTVAGGYWNTVSALAATVAGGSNNTVSGSYAVVAGGIGNIASGVYAAIAGGGDNTANGHFSIVAGGVNNIATGNYSFVAGRSAQANHHGTFVWGDNSETSLTSTADNQFLIRASGGVGIGTNAPAASLHTTGSIRADGGEFQSWGSIGLRPDVDNSGDDIVRFLNSTGDETMRVDFNGNVGVGTNAPAYKLHVNGSVAGVGNYQNLSDGRFKQNIATFENALETLLNLRGVIYEWKPTDGMNFAEGRQIGFIAQEVEKVLPELVIADSKGIKSVAYANIVPVAVEAIKTLNTRSVMLQKQINAKDAEIGELKAMLNALAERVNALEAGQRK